MRANVTNSVAFAFKYIVVPIVLVLIGAILSANFLINKGKEITANYEWYDNDRGIDIRETITIGGVDQAIRIRGRDLSNPVLLDLHGGPGGAFQDITYRAYRPLTEFYTIVEWDQRGAGRSQGRDQVDVTYEDMVSDGVEVIEFLQTRLQVEKVVLVGHSWGTLLGLGIIEERPDLISVYVGVGQAFDLKTTLDESRRLTAEAAKDAGDLETFEFLNSLSNELPDSEEWDVWLEWFASIQDPMKKYGSSTFAVHDMDPMLNELILDAALSPSLSFSEALTVLGPKTSETTNSLIKHLFRRSFTSDSHLTFDVPIFIFQGDHDGQTPTTLVKDWFPKVEAPYKEYVAFEDSAHFVFNEEPGKYLFELVSKVRPFAIGEAEISSSTDLENVD